METFDVSDPPTGNVTEPGDMVMFVIFTSSPCAPGARHSANTKQSVSARNCFILFIVTNHPFSIFKKEARIR